jgi:hypothetical protein
MSQLSSLTWLNRSKRQILLRALWGSREYVDAFEFFVGLLVSVHTHFANDRSQGHFDQGQPPRVDAL